MRHFYSERHLLVEIREEAERLGCSILERKGRVYAVGGMTCECGFQTITDVDLTDMAERLWSKFAGSASVTKGSSDE